MTRARATRIGRDGKPAIPESALLANIIKAARLCGWKSAHFRPAMTRRGRWVTPVQGDGKGWPDLVLVKNGRIWFVECKSEGGKLTAEQRDWVYALRKVQLTTAAVKAWIIRPSDFDSFFEDLKRF